MTKSYPKQTKYKTKIEILSVQTLIAKRKATLITTRFRAFKINTALL